MAGMKKLVGEKGRYSSGMVVVVVESWEGKQNGKARYATYGHNGRQEGKARCPTYTHKKKN